MASRGEASVWWLVVGTHPETVDYPAVQPVTGEMIQDRDEAIWECEASQAEGWDAWVIEVCLAPPQDTPRRARKGGRHGEV